MHNAEVIQQFVDATNLAGLRIAFSKLCAGAGDVEKIEIFLYGSYGDFSAFCTAQMRSKSAENTLLTQYGFQRLGSRVFLPRALPPEFERRVLARVA